MGKLLKRIRADKIERRARIRAIIYSLVNKRIAIPEKVVADIAGVAQGAHDVKHDVSIEKKKGTKAGVESGLSATIAGLIFIAVRKNIDLSPDIENYVAGTISVIVTTLFSYVKKRILNRIKIKAIEE